MDRRSLNHTVRWIEEHIGEGGLTLGAVARHARCSRYHFSRVFREQFGLSVVAYTRMRALVHAAASLDAGDSVVSVAMQHGYASQSAFARAFRRAFGRSPTAYRAMTERCRSVHRGKAMEIRAVENVESLRRVFGFGDLVLDYTLLRNTVYSWEFWMEQFRRNPHLLLYAQKDGEIVGAAWGWVEANNNVTVGMVAVSEACRRQGIGRKLMDELVRRVKAAGHRTIALGARKDAEGFYVRCGFQPTLFL